MKKIHGGVEEEVGSGISEVLLDGFPKHYTMTGWRLGYLVVSPGELRAFQKMQQNFQISANSFVQSAGIEALSKEGDEAVERMRRVYDKRRKLIVELVREVGFNFPVMPQGAFYVFADASNWTEDSYAFAFELLEKAGVGVALSVDFWQAGKRAVRFSYASNDQVFYIATAITTRGGSRGSRRGPLGGSRDAFGVLRAALSAKAQNFAATRPLHRSEGNGATPGVDGGREGKRAQPAIRSVCPSVSVPEPPPPRAPERGLRPADRSAAQLLRDDQRRF